MLQTRLRDDEFNRACQLSPCTSILSIHENDVRISSLHIQASGEHLQLKTQSLQNVENLSNFPQDANPDMIDDVFLICLFLFEIVF